MGLLTTDQRDDTDTASEPSYLAAEHTESLEGLLTGPPANGHATPPETLTARTPLRAEQINVVAARVAAAPPPTYLYRPVWPQDAYGMKSAENKAGKTWIDADQQITAASGKAWLTKYDCERAGPVIAYWGEASERKLVRRLRAVANFYDVDLDDLPIHVESRVPHLSNAFDLGDIYDDLDRIRPVLVCLDPLYLAARGVKGSDLFGGVGVALEPMQRLCETAGAAFSVSHHWNQSGKGTGRERMSGAGPAEWGRVLMSVAVESRRTIDNHISDVVLSAEFFGDEIADSQLRFRRRVWADDPADLASPMHYELELLAELDPADRILPDEKPAVGRVLAVLIATDKPTTVHDIGDRLAVDDTGLAPLKARTIQDSLKRLAELGRAHRHGATESGAALWQLGAADPEPEPEMF